MAFASLGGQQNRLACAITNSMQQSDAIVRYSLEVHRAIANRIMRERHDREARLRREIEIAEKAKTYNQAGAEAFERGRKADEELAKKLFNNNFIKILLTARKPRSKQSKRRNDIR